MELFAGVNWLAVGIGAVASFAVGWLWYSPRLFYPAWSKSAGVSHEPGDPMGAAFGSLTLGLILYAVFVGIMVAQEQVPALVFGIVTFVVMGYSNNAFKKLGPTSRTIDAGSWAVSGAINLLVQWLL